MQERPPPLKSPDANFGRRKLTIATFPAGQRWIRLHRKDQAPDFFGQTGAGRFDSPNADFGTLYLAKKVAGAFAEIFCRQSIRLATMVRLSAFHVAEFSAERKLKLVDMTGPGPVRMGLGDGRLTSGDYRIAQLWAKAFHEHPAQPDGLLYRSRHDQEQELAAIFSRTEQIWKFSSHGQLSEYLNNEQFFILLDRYDYGLLPPTR